ncbi:phage tail protein I [Gynuella sunshinyii]|uniref:Bacteriophage P2-related tail formation protein n=1 Tax=Gynuella sunshinyii YC6258 TaxID=1445510 RepID=A0A0C5VFB1_9GAMM|nr:phage tail protein I [Gynuella sunshinyii]AJQ93227.1 bacteriophage P2-related tail formation protein [Gynuella sunshinyii YC6258]
MVTKLLNPGINALQFINEQIPGSGSSRALSGRVYVDFSAHRDDLVSYEIHWGNATDQKLIRNSLIAACRLKKNDVDGIVRYCPTAPLMYRFSNTEIPSGATCLLVFARDDNDQEYLYAKRDLIIQEHLLPPSASSLERNLAAVAARLSRLPVNIHTLWNGATCPDELLPWLGWAVSTDVWVDNPNDPQEEARRRRDLIRDSAFVHKHKGTRGAVQQALNSFTDANVTLTEWWQQSPPGAPYTFHLDLLINNNMLGLGSAVFDRKLREVIDAVKPVRSHYTFTFSTVQTSTLQMAAATQAVSFMRFNMSATLPPQPTTIDTNVLEQ